MRVSEPFAVIDQEHGVAAAEGLVVVPIAVLEQEVEDRRID